jgi:hypothetical protein
LFESDLQLYLRFIDLRGRFLIKIVLHENGDSALDYEFLESLDRGTEITRKK